MTPDKAPLPPGIQALIDRVNAAGGLQLPSLSREELLTLGSPGHPLIGAAEARWLGELGDGHRKEASTEGAATLGERGLVARSQGSVVCGRSSRSCSPCGGRQLW